MQYNFCTLFDSNYLSRGIAMYESLAKHCNDFHLFIFPFDNVCYSVLQKLNLKNTTLVRLEEFEDEKLLSVKGSRTRGEYCWTCTSSVILYVLEKFKVNQCTYLDADLFFYSDPAILIDEIKNKSVQITPHNFSDENLEYEKYGKYCVQFVTFVNDKNGLDVLKQWRDDCIKWCYARLENNKFGDQKYLDTWTGKYECVVELKNIHSILAPWNVQKYRLTNRNGFLHSEFLSKSLVTKIVFYHFHDLKFIKEVFSAFGISLFSRRKIVYANYNLGNQVKKYIYKPYIRQLLTIRNKLKEITPIDSNGTVIIERKFERFIGRIFNMVQD